MEYEAFIAGKHVRAKHVGFEPPLELNAALFPFQRQIVTTVLRRGECAVFGSPGIGKTLMQAETARQGAAHSGKPSLIIAPLAVAWQTRAEAARFGIEVTLCREAGDVRPGANVTNYDRLDRFDLSQFGMVLLDESSILKSYMGKTKRALIERCAAVPYRSCWTATPAPNDHMEIGNHAEFLGVMPSAEMLTRWFINDTSQTGAYRLKGHAEADFWRWVASWAVSLRRPSDLGDYDDAGYVLPPLHVETVTVGVDIVEGRGEQQLFREPTLSATEMHAELRRTAPARAAAVAEIVAREPGEQWLLWCNTNEEADRIVAAIPDAVEVRGSDSAEWKERASAWFAGLYEEECECPGNPSTRQPESGASPKTPSTPSDTPRISPALPRSDRPTQSSGGSTCASGSSGTASTSEPTGLSTTTSATLGGASSTPPTSSAESAPAPTRSGGARRTPRNTSKATCASTNSRSPSSGSSSPSREAAAPCADGRSAPTTPSEPGPGSDGSTSTTATEPGRSEGCSAPSATSASASSTTTPSDSNAPPCTCGKLTARRRKILVSKSLIFGMGMNFQACARVAFVGLNYSFEQFFQALCRTHRFGQTREVKTYVIAATTEGAIGATVERKAREYERMMDAMVKHARDARGANGLTLSESVEEVAGEGWRMQHGDCVLALKGVPDGSLDFCIHSPPFSNLYIYSDSQQDMGNAKDDAEFFAHYDFAIRELHRAMRPGRLVAVHCKQLVKYQGRDGVAGIRDFRGEIIAHFERAGFQYHSEVTIWTDPVLEMQRTKAHGLLYKQLRADSSFSRQGLAEYLVVFRKWAAENDDAAVVPVTHTKDSLPLDVWQRYASPVWMDIKRTDVLNVAIAREAADEKHICPLQLSVIERAVDLWTNPGDLVFSPFAGIGSEGVVSVKMGRRFLGVELKRAYFDRACRFLAEAAGRKQLGLFGEVGT
jgi:DNA modification methylase